VVECLRIGRRPTRERTSRVFSSRSRVNIRLGKGALPRSPREPAGDEKHSSASEEVKDYEWKVSIPRTHQQHLKQKEPSRPISPAAIFHARDQKEMIKDVP
jgi:hypothetical protein